VPVFILKILWTAGTLFIVEKSVCLLNVLSIFLFAKINLVVSSGQFVFWSKHKQITKLDYSEAL
jgi:hypothetical protein